MTEDNKHLLGKLGEELVARLEKAILSEDKFDTIKDMIDSNGKNIEVKTQNRYRSKNIFSINTKSTTNIKKCLTVDRLLFVEYDSTDIIKIYECIDKNSGYYYITNSNIKMFGWPINKMKLLHLYQNKTLAKKMRSLSNNKYI
jgi:hypothetical protein